MSLSNLFSLYDSPRGNFWREDTIEVESGGFTISSTAFKSTTTGVCAGTPVAVNRSARTCVLVKTLRIKTGGTTTIPYVEKNNEAKVGDIFLLAAGGQSRTISSIDSTTSTLHDIITFDGAFTGLVAGNILQEAATASATAAVANNITGFVRSDVPDLQTKTNRMIALVVGAREVYENRMPYPVPAAEIALLKDRFQFI